MMWPFFTFYGGKWRAAPRYPIPLCDTIVEPFAGAAGYSVRHFEKRIILVEKDPVIAALWRYLIKSKENDILNLPLIRKDQTIYDLDICDEAKSLIGFWLNKACNAPRKSPSKWMRLSPKSFWGPEIRSRIASQIKNIKHWTIIEGDYSESPNIRATWFIDPPYQKAGRLYKYSSKKLDFQKLAEYCKQRLDQSIVCENDGADWLSFEPFITIMSTKGKHGKSQSKESLWEGI